MPGKIVSDSSVIAAIFFKEEASERASRVAEKFDIVTIDVAAAEIGNVAWKRVVFFNESRKNALEALKKSISFIMDVCDVINSHELLENGFEIAVAEKITFYDALFIAASEREKVPLLTLDKKLYEKLHEMRNVSLI
jgi:predicted nucleic acid-binding protein